MINSIDAEKVFDKIQHIFMIKTFQKAGMKGTCLNIIKTIYEKSTVNIILNGRVHTLMTTIQHSFESPSHSDQRRKIKGIQLGKEEVKVSLFADDMILNIKKLKDTNRKLLELINEYSKVSGYKINAQKFLAFLYSNNEKTEI